MHLPLQNTIHHSIKGNGSPTLIIIILELLECNGHESVFGTVSTVVMSNLVIDAFVSGLSRGYNPL